MSCLFCNSNESINYVYPKNNFNNKEFRYVKCRQCKLVYLNNLPDEQDYAAMYPPSYQSNAVQTGIQANPYIKLPGLRYSYGDQFDLVKKFTSNKARILDYGCGTGHFIANAAAQGFTCDGAEFSIEYLSILRKGFSKSNFFTIADVLADNFSEKYDVIRLSNVLEHLTRPTSVIKKLTTRLRSGGMLLVEGPIEENFCLANVCRKLYFKIGKWIKSNRVVSDPPFHIFFSNAKNQRQFFKDCGFTETHFDTSEDPWPFPDSVRTAKGFKNKLMALVAKVSIYFTKLSGRKWGNIFIYTGKQTNSSLVS